MEVVNGKYMVECTPSGDYYGYLMGYDQCCAYGETVEDVIKGDKTKCDKLSYSA